MSYNKTWISPDKIIKKTIIEQGISSLKPADNSICTIEITDAIFKHKIISEYIDVTYPLDIIIGEANTSLDRQIDKCVTMMLKNELSNVIITLADCEINFNIKLCDFTHRGYIYEWSAKEKLCLAHKHKEKGIDLFKINRYQDASHRFSRALKLLLSIPVPVDDVPDEVDGIKLDEIVKLEANLYNNLASCYSKEKLYDSVVSLCTKVLEIESDDLRALYKRGCAYAETKDFEKAHKDLTKLLVLDPENKAAQEKIKFISLHLSQEEAKFNSMVKKMFRT